jgi:hypothetical protein
MGIPRHDSLTSSRINRWSKDKRDSIERTKPLKLGLLDSFHTNRLIGHSSLHSIRLISFI